MSMIRRQFPMGMFDMLPAELVEGEVGIECLNLCDICHYEPVISAIKYIRITEYILMVGLLHDD
jgi:hypothetical protein